MRFGSKPGQRSGLGLRRVCQECVISTVTSSGCLAAPISLTIPHAANTITSSLISAASLISIPQASLSQKDILNSVYYLTFPCATRVLPRLLTSLLFHLHHRRLLIAHGPSNSLESLTLPRVDPGFLPHLTRHSWKPLKESSVCVHGGGSFSVHSTPKTGLPASSGSSVYKLPDNQ